MRFMKIHVRLYHRGTKYMIEGVKYEAIVCSWRGESKRR